MKHEGSTLGLEDGGTIRKLDNKTVNTTFSFKQFNYFDYPTLGREVTKVSRE